VNEKNFAEAVGRSPALMSAKRIVPDTASISVLPVTPGRSVKEPPKAAMAGAPGM